MKQRIFLIIVLLTSAMFGCRKYLDVRPKSQIKSEMLLADQRGFSDALTGVYTLMARRDLYGDNLTMSIMDVLAQRYKVPTRVNSLYDMANYNYQSASVEAQFRTFWLNEYNCIVNLNNLLAQIDEKKSVFTEDNYALIKGEALGLRAFLHFDLLRMFGPIYSVSPDGNAIPYRLKVGLEAQAPQTASEVAGLIIKDLKEAEVLLAKDPLTGAQASDLVEFDISTRRQRMNVTAVEGVLARVYMYMGMKNDAYSYAKKVISRGLFNFVTDQSISASGNCKDRLFRNELLFSLFVNNMKVYTDNYFNVVPTTYENLVLNNDDDVIKNVFENSSTDYRLQYLWESVSGKLLFRKYQQFDSGSITSSGCSNASNLVPLLRISEMYYIAAECSPSLAESADLLNEVLTHRGLGAISINSSDDLRKALTAEYQKEFFGEGQLFYYYKRLNFSAIPGTSVPATPQVYQFPTPVDEIVNN